MYLLVDFAGEQVYVQRTLKPNDIQMIRVKKLLCFFFDGTTHRYQRAHIVDDEHSSILKWTEQEPI